MPFFHSLFWLLLPCALSVVGRRRAGRAIRVFAVGDVVDGNDERGHECIVIVVVNRQDERIAQRDLSCNVTDLFPVEYDPIIKLEDIADDLHFAQVRGDEIAVVERENLSSDGRLDVFLGVENERLVGKQTPELVANDVFDVVLQVGQRLLLRKGEDFALDFQNVVAVHVLNHGRAAERHPLVANG